ncbi:single-stranded DNA-binding protein [Nocardia sp. NPDC051832]|uniref:single-stranded DNA-binding protein n=1 Tax=Nocardia sp. NPDC051832 TaxID=3155673 RepID=UPI003412E691
MAGEIFITVMGNLTAKPDYYAGTPEKSAFIAFTVAQNTRVFRNGEWRDGNTVFMRCTAFGELAANMAASLDRGDRVIVYGRIQQREYTDREDVRRTSTEVIADEIAPSLRYATATMGEPASAAAPEPDKQRTPAKATGTSARKRPRSPKSEPALAGTGAVAPF